MAKFFANLFGGGGGGGSSPAPQQAPAAPAPTPAEVPAEAMGRTKTDTRFAGATRRKKLLEAQDNEMKQKLGQ